MLGEVVVEGVVVGVVGVVVVVVLVAVGSRPLLVSTVVCREAAAPGGWSRFVSPQNALYRRRHHQQHFHQNYQHFPTGALYAMVRNPAMVGYQAMHFH